MKSIFIIHGSYGSPQENWFPWLKKELSKLGHKVLVPQFPVPPIDKQDSSYSGYKLSEWIETLNDYSRYIDSNTIFIAHSRGCILTYHYLAKIKPSISATFLVAPWINFLWYPKNNRKIDSFHQAPFDWKKIKKGSRYFEVYQSTNDDTPVSEGEKIAKKLAAKLVVVKNAGHFSASTDKKFKEFSLLLDNVKDFIDKNP